MSGITMKVDGLDEVLRKLDTVKMQQDITDELIVFGMGVKRDAVQTLAEDLKHSNGGLINSVNSESKAPLSVTISVHKDYAAFVEFGTGPYAAAYVPSLDPEWQAYAATFYINGQGRIPATPYLYPAFEKNRIELIKNLKNLLK